MESEALTGREMIVSLMPVIVGGLIAIVGGLAGGVLTHILQSMATRREQRRVKLEEMVAYTFEVEAWLDQKRAFCFWGHPDTSGVSPLEKCRAAAMLYFPELRPAFSQFFQAATKLNLWALEGGQKKNPQGQVPKEHLDKFNDVFKPFHEAHLHLVDKASELMGELK